MCLCGLLLFSAKLASSCSAGVAHKQSYVRVVQAARQQADRLLGLRAVRDSNILEVDWSPLVSSLHAGEYSGTEDLAAEVHADCHAAAEAAISEGMDVRLGRLKGLAEQLALAVQDSLQVRLCLLPGPAPAPLPPAYPDHAAR